MVLSGAVRVKVMVPLGLSPPDRTAVSLRTAVPTTPPSLAVVTIVGLAGIVVAVSLTPLSLAGLFFGVPVLGGAHGDTPPPGAGPTVVVFLRRGPAHPAGSPSPPVLVRPVPREKKKH